MNAAFFATKERILYAPFVVDSFFLPNQIGILLLPIQGETFLASPLFATVAEFAPWAYALLAVIAPAPFAAPPVQHLREPLSQMLLEFWGRY